MIINPLNNKDLLNLIFEYLPAEDINVAKATSHLFLQASRNEKLPQRLMISKLAISVIQSNALNLWRYPEGNFNVNEAGQLIRIKWYHLFARFFKWINDKNVTQNVNKVVSITFQEIYRLNQQGYLNRRELSIENFKPKHIYVWDMLATQPWNESHYFPAHFLSDRIKNSKQFGSLIEMDKYLDLIKNQRHQYNIHLNKFPTLVLIRNPYRNNHFYSLEDVQILTCDEHNSINIKDYAFYDCSFENKKV